MSEEHKRDMQQYEEAHHSGKKKGGFAGHCKRFWWVYALVTVLVIVLVVLLVIFVAVPKIAQKKIDEAVLNLQGISATNTQSLNFTMGINSSITTDGSVHATIDGFEGVMYLEDLEPHRPFCKLQFPQTESAAFQVVNLTQFVPIDDLDAFTTFNTWLLHNTTLRVTLKGDTYVHINGLSRAYPVTFQKTVEMPGLQAFNGTTVSNVEISATGFPDGSNMHGSVTIPNRSLVTFEIGNATFINYLLGEEIGKTWIDNIVLRPGLNDFPMRSNVEQLPVLSAMGEHPYCQTGELPFELKGESVINHGQPLRYYADALASSNQTVPINLLKPLSAIGLDIKCG